jgi:hypothetical protein
MHPHALALVILGAHLAATTSARANPAKFDPESVSRGVQASNSAAFGALAAMLYFNGGLARWPNILPLSAVLGGVYGLGAVASGVFRVPSKMSAFLWSSGVITFISTVYYAIAPSTEGWLRHVGLAVFLLFGVPVIYAIPRVLANRTSPDHRLLAAALDASNLSYNRARDSTFKDAEYLTDASTGTQVGISSADAPDGTRDIFIAFAGTSTKTDWLKTNLKFGDATYPESWVCSPGGTGGAKVHAGFLSAYSSVREKTLKMISDYVLRTAASGKIIVCGHSLGGALAAIAAIDIMCHLEPAQKSRVQVISFGSPHVGDQAFATLFDSIVPSCTRVVTVYDPVPNVLSGRYVRVKGTYTVTAPLIDNPINGHSIPAYKRALAASSASRTAFLALPLVIVAFFLTLFASIGGPDSR